MDAQVGRLLDALEQRIGRQPVSDFKALRDYDAVWRRLGALPLSAFALDRPIEIVEPAQGISQRRSMQEKHSPAKVRVKRSMWIITGFGSTPMIQIIFYWGMTADSTCRTRGAKIGILLIISRYLSTMRSVSIGVLPIGFTGEHRIMELGGYPAVHTASWEL